MGVAAYFRLRYLSKQWVVFDVTGLIGKLII